MLDLVRMLWQAARGKAAPLAEFFDASFGFIFWLGVVFIIIGGGVGTAGIVMAATGVVGWIAVAVFYIFRGATEPPGPPRDWWPW